MKNMIGSCEKVNFVIFHTSKHRIYESGNEKLKNYESGTWKLNCHESCIRKLKICESGLEKLENHQMWES